MSQKYQTAQNGNGLLEMPWHGKTVSVEVQVRSYYDNGNLALLLKEWNHGEPEPWGNLTVNLDPVLNRNCAFVDVNNLGQEVLPWLEETGLATPTGRTQQSGYVTYPEYHFNPDRLTELDQEGYQDYMQRFEQNHFQEPSMTMQ